MAKKSFLSTKGSGGIMTAIIVIMVAIFVFASMWFSSLSKTATYYVLTKDVPAQTVITPDMLKPVVVGADAKPEGVLTLADVQKEEYVTRINLEAGKNGVVVPLSAVASKGSTTAGLKSQIPSDWVTTSFTLNSDKALSGNVRSGDYVDILVTSQDGSFYPFVNVKILDTTLSDKVVKSGSGESSSTYTQSQAQFIVGMPPAQAGRLQHVFEIFDNINLVLASDTASRCGKGLESYDGKFTWDGLKGERNGSVNGLPSPNSENLTPSTDKDVNAEFCSALSNAEKTAVNQGKVDASGKTDSPSGATGETETAEITETSKN